jgi:dihydropteroate synthase
MTTHTWRIRPGLDLALDRPRIMAILNVTPDSFADGGRFTGVDDAVGAAREAAAHADVLDIGAESTRPGAARVPPEVQIARAVPVIRAVRESGAFPGPISIDTTNARVARAALDAGADAINDVSAGTDDAAMLELAAGSGVGIVLMHRLAPPQADFYSDQYLTPPRYADVMAEVRSYLGARLRAAADAGVNPLSVVLDPGLGFGKTVAQNTELIRRTGELLELGRPVLSGLSRKSFTGRLGFDRETDPSERLPPTLALSVVHLSAGARVFRVHDPGPARAALRAAWATLSLGG